MKPKYSILILRNDSDDLVASFDAESLNCIRGIVCSQANAKKRFDRGETIAIVLNRETKKRHFRFAVSWEEQ